MPDIDIDFPWDERDNILEYVFKKYGKKRTAMVANQVFIRSRSAVREVGKVYGLSQEEIKSLIDSYRKNPLKFISESRVKYFCDYSTSIKRNLIDKTNEKISLPKSNVIEFESIDGFKIILRPSGTEPKIKMYISVNADLDNINEFESVNSTLENKIKEIVESIDL